MAIKKVAVIGAGVMGAGIAAQLTNAGYEVELLDRVDPKNPTNRTAIAEGAIEKMLKANPAPFMHKKNAKKIRPGNMEDHADRLKECDLIIEAVFEDPKVKFDIFQKIDANRKPGSIVASNTSTIPLKNLIDGQSDQFKKDFVITHFFNPPRYMQLLELITSEHNDPAMVAEIARFMDEKMGKGVVVCNDTPGFIGNRIGTFWLQTAINEAYKKDMTIEEADAVMGRPFGIPKTGVFGLIDLVGLDIMPYISKSLTAKLPADDSYVKNNVAHPVIEQMIKDGFVGRKSKTGGFYRRDENKQDFSVDLKTGNTRPKKKAKLKSLDASKKKGMKALLDAKDKGGQYAWDVVKQTLCYAAEHAHTITSDITGVDTAMKLGYGWKYGPFELMDKIGVDYIIKRLEKEKSPVPDFLKQAKGRTFYRTEKGQLQYLYKDGSYKDVKRPDGVLLLSDIKRKSKPVADFTKNVPMVGTMGAAIWDIGDGVLCLEFTSKMNSLDLYTMKAINKACDMIEKGGKYKALVIHNEGDDFCVGANLGVAAIAGKIKQFWVIDKMVKLGQDTYKRMKYAKFPIVSAPSGKALGGGCEILLHSSHVQAHSETYIGLVEVGVGLLPGWGGCTELMTRAKQNKKIPNGPMPATAAIFETISTAKVALSAFEAKDLMYLRQSDGVTMNKSRLLADAKTKALELAKDYKPEVPVDLELAGPSGRAALNMAVDGFFLKGSATTYDVVVSDKVAEVLTGGDEAGPGRKVTQDYMRELERKCFMQLAHDPRTLARINKILKEGKPLREKPIAGATSAGLREAANDPGVIGRMTKKAKKAFGQACPSKGVTKDPKPKVNWPKIGGK